MIFAKTLTSFFEKLSTEFAFATHNRKYFPRSVPNDSEPVVLIEFNSLCSNHIAVSYLANVLASRHNAVIKAYLPYPNNSLKSKARFLILRLFAIISFGVYCSFGVDEFICISLDPVQKRKSYVLFNDVYKAISCKRDIEDMHVEGIWIGDLIYDTFLRRYNVPTIDITSRLFKSFLLESLQTFTFWTDYFNCHNVSAINVSHCVYNLAIPLRIALHLGIDAFQATLAHIYRLSIDRPFAYSDFTDFPAIFSKLPQDVREAGLVQAKKQINKRFSGEIGVDMEYSTKSAFGSFRHTGLLPKSPRKKILVASHCFFDSPHSYGKNLFPDFYEWLEFLGQLSVRKNYDFFIKIHPDYLPGTKEVIDSFVDRYPNFTLLPSDASHMQIISEGIDVALTCYGTIGFEYAALGVPVVNASINNPHIAYDFNIHARDVEHYTSILDNLDDLRLEIKLADVLEFYYMSRLHPSPNIFFEDLDETVHILGGYMSQFTFLIYKKWLADWSICKHRDIINIINDYISSGDFRLQT